jgi:membrane fusion protein, multidrug efflux system
MKKNQPKLIYLLGIILFLFLISCKHTNPQQIKKNFNTIPAVEGFVVKSMPVHQSVLVSGTIKPYEETTLMPEAAGRIVMLKLPEGKHVKHGELLVKLFDDDLQANLSKLTTQLQIAEQTEKRLSELIRISGISQSDYDQAVLQVNSIKADIEIVNVQIRKTEVRAPFDGVIGLRNISMGAEVTVQTPLAVIRQTSRLKLDFSVPEKYGSLIKNGTDVTFTVQGKEDVFEAKVIATEEGIDAATRNMKARAEISMNKKTAGLKPGAFAAVELTVDKNPNALMVPTQAIIPQENGKKLILSKNNKAVFIPVKTGVRLDSIIEITKGVSEGDTVATSGLLFLKPGSILKFSKISG